MSQQLIVIRRSTSDKAAMIQGCPSATAAERWRCDAWGQGRIATSWGN